MTRKQLVALCLCSFVIYANGGALVGLLPVYLDRLGADSTVTGLFLAFINLALAISTVTAGWLSDRLQRRKALLLAGAVVIGPAILLMGHISSVLLLVIVFAVTWFMVGVVITMTNVLAGLFSEPGNRHRIFGILVLSVNFGLVFGSAVSGRIVDAWGYSGLFASFGLLCLIVPVAALFAPEKAALVRTRAGAPARGIRTIFANRTFTLLFVATILIQVSNSFLILARPLIMDLLHFDATAITTSAAVGALVTLPLPLLIGAWSKRFGNKSIIAACYLTTTAGLIVLAVATQAWQFWLAGALQACLGVSMVVASALVTDLFPSESLGTSLALINSAPWIAYVIGFGGGGAAISGLTMTPTLLLVMLLSLVAVLLLIPISARKSNYAAETV